jgi:CheY-like chemotaxis protein
MVKKNILLVDDDSIANFLIEKIIESTGLARNIFKALNGREALEYFYRVNDLPEVVLLDLNMPVMNGFEFMKAFQMLDLKGKEDVLVIMVTSSGNPSDIEKARSLGIRHYLTKPISADMIRSIIIGEFSGAPTNT